MAISQGMLQPGAGTRGDIICRLAEAEDVGPPQLDILARPRSSGDRAAVS